MASEPRSPKCLYINSPCPYPERACSACKERRIGGGGGKFSRRWEMDRLSNEGKVPMEGGRGGIHWVDAQEYNERTQRDQWDKLKPR